MTLADYHVYANARPMLELLERLVEANRQAAMVGDDADWRFIVRTLAYEAKFIVDDAKKGGGLTP